MLIELSPLHVPHKMAALNYSGTSVIRAVWDQGVPVTLKLPVSLNLFMTYVRTVHGYIKTLDRWKERAAKLSPSVGALTLEHP